LNFEIAPTSIVKDLSTGDCQIVEVLKALMRNASIIVMDEPTSSLSEKGTQRLFQVVRELREQGISIIYISHRLEEITGLADDITVLRDGRVVQSDSAKKMDIPQIVRYMVGRELTELFPERNVKLGEVCVKVENLSSAQRVTDVSFDIRSGEIVAMAGLVGAGRTEVAETIFGVAPKIAGRIVIDGREITVNCPADAINNGIALLTEDRKRTGLCLQLPCGWNITLPNLKGIGMDKVISPNKENKIAAEIAGRIGIKWLGPQSPAESLSGGNQQKLLIARWLLAKSKFMIFDEPTRGIDVGAKKEVYSLLNQLAEQGKAILFIS
jgi:ABC-type sugar transport system ATPase subunit